MARYIDAYKLEKDLPQSVPKHNVIINWNEYPVFLVDHILHMIRNYPTADVVKHAKWVNGFCSNCRELNPTSRLNERTLEFEESYLPYCPNCGAKMDGKDTNVPTK